MKTCTAKLKSASAYSQSRAHLEPRAFDKESPDAYDERTWRSKAHVNEAGEVVIPGMAFKMALDRAAAFLSIKIPGRRNATYTKHFQAGVLVLDNCPTGVAADQLEPERLYVNADGVRGSGKRVWRTFPLIREWRTECSFYIADDTIPKEVFETVLGEAGKFIGIGRFRPEKGGYKGRFEVVSTAWA